MSPKSGLRTGKFEWIGAFSTVTSLIAGAHLPAFGVRLGKRPYSNERWVPFSDTNDFAYGDAPMLPGRPLFVAASSAEVVRVFFFCGNTRAASATTF